MAQDYLIRHVVPEALGEVKKEILKSVQEIIVQSKIRTITIPSESEQIMRQFSTYGGLLRSLAELTNEKFGAAGQKILIPAVVSMINKFMKEKKLNEDSLMGVETKPLIKSILDRLSAAYFSLYFLLQSILRQMSCIILESYSILHSLPYRIRHNVE